MTAPVQRFRLRRAEPTDRSWKEVVCPWWGVPQGPGVPLPRPNRSMVRHISGPSSPDPDHVLLRGIGVENMSCTLPRNRPCDGADEVVACTAIAHHVAKADRVIMSQAGVQLA